jgi:hypothetical protein
MTWGEVVDELLYAAGGLVFAVGTSARAFGYSVDDATQIMVSGLGFAILADMRLRRIRQKRSERVAPKERG